jgi:hypothetical protein
MARRGDGIYQRDRSTARREATPMTGWIVSRRTAAGEPLLGANCENVNDRCANRSWARWAMESVAYAGHSCPTSV